MQQAMDTLTAEPRQVGRYSLFGEIAAGGMATVHFGLLNGPVGFRRTVAIKRLHDQFSRDPEFVTQFLDEARLAARIRHPNVVQTLDVVTERRELLLVMEYVDGETLGRLFKSAARKSKPVPVDIVAGILAGALHGLHAAHEATSEHGEPLNIVHRDVSPQNILIGRDGVARVLDFGVAKAAARFHSTRSGQIKGKLAYMSPEQVSAQPMDRRTDVFAAGIVLWEALTGGRLFGQGDEDAAAIINKVLSLPVQAPSSRRDEVGPALDRVVMKALAREPKERFQTAADFAIALEEAVTVPSTHAIGRWLSSAAGEELARRADVVQRIEADGMAELTPSSRTDLGAIGDDEATRVEGSPPVSALPASTVPGDALAGSRRRRRNALLLLALFALLSLAFAGGLLLRPLGSGQALASMEGEGSKAAARSDAAGSAALASARPLGTDRPDSSGPAASSSAPSTRPGSDASAPPAAPGGAVAQSPGAQSPGAQSPGAQSPGAQSPGAQSPGAQSPGAQSPGAQSPGAQSPARTTQAPRTAPGTAAGQRPRKSPPRKGPPQKKASPPKVDCSNPVRVDKQGIRHFRPECL